MPTCPVQPPTPSVWLVVGGTDSLDTDVLLHNSFRVPKIIFRPSSRPAKRGVIVWPLPQSRQNKEPLHNQEPVAVIVS